MTFEHAEDLTTTLPGPLPAGPGQTDQIGPVLPPTQAAPEKACDIFGTFWIENTEFGLPVDALQEVVNEPTSISPVPLSSEHMVGLFNLRGMIIPLIDLRRLLDFDAPTRTEVRKVAIIEHGDLCVGLLFDETGGVVNADAASRINFERRSDGAKDVVIEGILKLENGSRTIQVLNPYELLNIQRLPRVRKVDMGAKARNARGARKTCISFELGHTTCALDLLYVQEVMDVPPVEKTRLTHGYVLGSINLRGFTLPVVDFRSIVGKEEPFNPGPEALRKRKLIVLNLPEGQIGLLVFAINSIIPYYDDDILNFAQVALPRQDIVNGCLVTEEEEIVILLNGEKLHRDADLVSAAKACQEIYPPALQETKKTEDAAALRRRTFILFSIDRRFAMDIDHVSEVIDRPDKLLAPPYALTFVEGIINLRGELITLINPWLLYSLPGKGENSKKVLIFKQGEQKYGLLVDSVDEMVMTNQGGVIDVPSIADNEAARKISQDVSGCLGESTQNLETGPTMILNTDALIKRCINVDD